MVVVTPVVEHWLEVEFYKGVFKFVTVDLQVIYHHLEREIAQWVHLMKDRSDDTSHHERTFLPQSYISLLFIGKTNSYIFIPSIIWWIDPSWGGPIELFLVPDLCNKGRRGMCYPICGMMHTKEPLLLIRKSSPCGGSGFPLSLSEWSFTICPTPYNRK